MVDSFRLRAVGPMFCLTAVLSAAEVLAEDAAPAATPNANTAPNTDEVQEVVVSGYRQALQSALNLKRASDVMVDAINAEDVAKFPDSNLAESLQRLPGISVDRDNGEGRTITVRGLGADFTRVRLNGLEALATAAAPDSGGAPNRSRGFDFNNFASDLFSSLQVRKTASADTDEGSLGATVDLQTPRPLDYKKDRYAFSAQDAYYEIGGYHRPRLAALMSQTWFDNKLGGAISLAYNDRKSQINRYRRQPGTGDFMNQQAFTGVTPARGGFSAPVGTSFGSSVTNPSAIAALTGSDPAAYAALFPGPPYSIPGLFNSSIVKVPGLINIEQQNLTESRIGMTGSLQWQPTERTLLSLDGLFSRFHQKSDISQIVDIGMNRNNTLAAYNTANAATPVGGTNGKRSMYPVCNSRPAFPFLAPLDCGGTEAVPGGVFPGFNGTTGTSFSTNPHNLDPYDYYNNPGSVGYPGAAAVAAAQGMYFRDALIGRPSTDVLAANVDEGGTADYLMLRNMDARSATDSSYFTTKFTQVSLSLQQEITDTLHADVLYGKSASLNHNQAFLVEFDRLDSPEPFVYDERARGPMPSVSYGFDVADPNNWSLVKGYSVIRHFERETDNRYSGGHLNFKWQMLEPLAVEFGWTRRDYKFSANEFRRPGSTETLNPTLLELGVNAQALGRVYNYGQGLNVPAGTPTSFFAPNINAFRSILGFDCNCVNKWGDWRITDLSTPGNQFAVDELDNSYFVQFDWDLEVLRRKFFGNVGVRYAKTAVTSDGFTTAPTLTGPRPLEASNNYHDLLPSLNAAYQLTEDLVLRTGVAKVMSRPLLSNLAPSISNLTTPSTPGSIGSLTIGNPKINPFRATNYDFSVEWYFTPGSLLSGAYFIKKVTNYPQLVASAGTIQSLLTPEEFTEFQQIADANQQAWLTSGGPNGTPGLYGILQYKDSPGGTIKGYELTFQQNLTFLPWYFRNLGVQFNYTHLSSELSYILDPGSTTAPVRPQTTTTGPFIGASPITSNATLFYESPLWSARVSMAYRGRYVTTYPIAAGACAPGSLLSPGVVCTTPLLNDFIGSKATRTYDAELTYNIGEHLTLTLEGLNLTAETDDRWVYQADPVVAQYSAPGRSYFAGFRLQF